MDLFSSSVIVSSTKNVVVLSLNQSLFLTRNGKMLKSKKSSRPEITIVGARPLNESPFIVDSFMRNLRSPTDPQKDLFKIPSNGVDCIISRTSTLPASRNRDKKQRPKSEIYNGFTSLRTTKAIKGDADIPQKEAKKVARSRSLHAPKKPPRDFSIRQTSTLPCSDKRDAVSPVNQMTSITPVRPAPPAPFVTFNKKSTTAKHANPGPMQPSLSKEDKKDKTKRNRSKSTSTASEKQKPRTPAPLPRGKSFNTHGSRQTMKTTQDGDVVILTRANIEDEPQERDVKLKTFGVKPSRSTDNFFPRKVGLEYERTNGIPANIAGSGGNDVKNVVNGRVSLSDAIHANAVYARLQQKSEEQIDPLDSASSLRYTHAEQKAKSCETLGDAINASPVLNKIKQKNQFPRENGSIRGDVADTDKLENTEVGSEVTSQNDSGRENGTHDTNEVGFLPNYNHSMKVEAEMSIEPVASRIVKPEIEEGKGNVGSCDAQSERSMSFDAGNRAVTPPSVRPKPNVPKRQSMEKVVLRPLDNVESGEKSSNANINEGTKSKSSPLVLQSRKSQTRLGKKDLGDLDKYVDNGTVEKESNDQSESKLENSVCHLSEDPLRISESKQIGETAKGADKNAVQCSTMEYDEKGINSATEATKTDDKISRNDSEGDNPTSRKLSSTTLDSYAGYSVQCAADDDNVFTDSRTLPRNKSESEVESSGSVDSLTSIASQITVIFNQGTSRAPASNSANQPAPFESHPSRNRRKSNPEPYSSHPERRPKPAKATPSTSTLKSKNRKSKSMIGRRLNSSPPSTPPPPPKLDHSEPRPETDKSKSKPPVPPRAPSMYIQDDSLSIVQSPGGCSTTATSKVPPPRPVKPPTPKSIADIRKKYSVDMVQPKEFVSPEARQSPSVQNGSGTISHEDSHQLSKLVVNGKAKHSGSNGTSVSEDSPQRSRDVSINESREDFTKKLEYFRNSIDKPQRSQVFSKQRSLDSCQERTIDVVEENTVSVEQLRREGEEALRIISQLKRDKGDVINGKRKSPIPQKPKRPLSVNMDSVVIFDANSSETNDKGNSSAADLSTEELPTEVGNVKDLKSDNRMPPAKPERSPVTFKADTFEGKTVAEEKICDKADQMIEERVPCIELRSKDAGMSDNLMPVGDKKKVPKKPTRTSSLKRKDANPMRVDVKKEPSINAVKEERTVKENGFNVLVKDETDSAPNVDLKSGIVLGEDTHTDMVKSVAANESEISNKQEIRSDCGSYLGVESEITDTYCNGESNDRPIGPVSSKESTLNVVVDRDTEKQRSDERSPEKIESSSDIISEECKSSLSDALSTQIDQLDRIMLETSSVLSESFTESFCDHSDTGNSDPPITENENQTNSPRSTSAAITSRTFADESKLSLGCPSESRNCDTSSDAMVNQLPDIGSKEPSTALHMMDAIEPQVKESQPCEKHPSCEIGTNDIIGKKPDDGSMGGNICPESSTSSHTPLNSTATLMSEFGSVTKTDKSVPPKPSRPKTSPKEVKCEKDRCTDVPVWPLDMPRTVPRRPSDPPAASASEVVRPCLRRVLSAPERPTLPCLTRKSRPPIPSILRENEEENASRESSDIDLKGNIPADMKISEPHGIALYDYASDNPKDLIFKTGDVIMIERRINSDWLEGFSNGRKGIFPLNFLEIIVPCCTESGNNDQLSLLETPAALAIYPFTAANETELTFDSGDTIELLSKISEDQLNGRCNGREGSFPASFVVVIKPLQEDVTADGTQTSDVEKSSRKAELVNAVSLNSGGHGNEEGKTESTEHSSAMRGLDKTLTSSVNHDLSNSICTAVSDFKGDDDGHLSFRNGDKIHLISYVDKEWLRGRLNGETGLFPRRFIKMQRTDNEN